MSPETFNFVVVPNTRRLQITSEPAVSVSGHPAFRFNKKATAILTANGGRYVTVRWDKEERKVAFSSERKQDPKTSYKLTVNRPGTQAAISARSFLQYVGWNGKPFAIALRAAEDGKLEGNWPKQEE